MPSPWCLSIVRSTARARGSSGARVSAALAALSGLSGCAPELVLGEWRCGENDAEMATPDPSAAIALPWSSGFERRFCDYTQLAGFCLTEPLASSTIVSSPVHGGRHAAAYQVNSADPDGTQARCVRQGGLPVDALYSVWFFLPRTATNDDVWNLVHFQGGTPVEQHGLWDISLVNGKDGQLEAVVYDFLHGEVYRPTSPVPVPIQTWFQLEFRLKRAANALGEVALYQDGRLLFEKKNLITDDTTWGQWFVGNYATRLSPPDFTLYVDDVAIRAMR